MTQVPTALRRFASSLHISRNLRLSASYFIDGAPPPWFLHQPCRDALPTLLPRLRSIERSAGEADRGLDPRRNSIASDWQRPSFCSGVEFFFAGKTVIVILFATDFAQDN